MGGHEATIKNKQSELREQASPGHLLHTWAYPEGTQNRDEVPRICRGNEDKCYVYLKLNQHSLLLGRVGIKRKEKLTGNETQRPGVRAVTCHTPGRAYPSWQSWRVGGSFPKAPPSHPGDTTRLPSFLQISSTTPLTYLKHLPQLSGRHNVGTANHIEGETTQGWGGQGCLGVTEGSASRGGRGYWGLLQVELPLPLPLLSLASLPAMDAVREHLSLSRAPLAPWSPGFLALRSLLRAQLVLTRPVSLSRVWSQNTGDM